MFLYGKNSVFERIKINPASIKWIYLGDNFNAPGIEDLIKSRHIPFKHLPKSSLYRIKRADSLQGIIAEVDNFVYADYTDLILNQRINQLSFIFLDRVFDPQNLGAMMRIAACFGRFAIVIPKHKACQVTEATLHVAQGAENFVPVAIVSNLTNALLEAKKCGFWAVGAVIKDGQDVSSLKLPFPLCLVLGSEGSDIRYGISKHLDVKAHILMEGSPLSFNVTAACAVFCYEIAKQRPKSEPIKPKV
jgi:23S rRNA (guanosine2251-2'-O)-methyltransferase